MIPSNIWGKQTYHKNDDDEEHDWNDDVHDVEERFAIQVNDKLNLRINEPLLYAEDATTTNGRTDHLPNIYKTSTVKSKIHPQRRYFISF